VPRKAPKERRQSGGQGTGLHDSVSPDQADAAPSARHEPRKSAKPHLLDSSLSLQRGPPLPASVIVETFCVSCPEAATVVPWWHACFVEWRIAGRWWVLRLLRGGGAGRAGAEAAPPIRSLACGQSAFPGSVQAGAEPEI
jgi:hypothetical protein